MARYRLSEPARADIASILRVSETRHGKEARVRCRGLLAAALKRIAADPQGFPTAGRSDLFSWLRSLHIRRGRDQSREAPVAEPVPVIFYRAAEPGVVEIVRVLHERMEPNRHVGSEDENAGKIGRAPLAAS